MELSFSLYSTKHLRWTCSDRLFSSNIKAVYLPSNFEIMSNGKQHDIAKSPEQFVIFELDQLTLIQAFVYNSSRFALIIWLKSVNLINNHKSCY